MSECKICHQPLGTFEISLHHSFHAECGQCIYCHEPVQLQLVLKFIESDSPIYHQPCHDRYMAEEIKKRPVTITQEMLDYYNEMNLCFQENTEISPHLNQIEAANMADSFHKKWFYQKSFDEQLIIAKRMEGIAVAFNLLVDKKKAKQAIDDREVKRVRRQADDQKIKAHEQAQAKLEKSDPAERAKMKAIKGIQSMQAGMTEAQAIEIYNSMTKGPAGGLTQ